MSISGVGAAVRERRKRLGLNQTELGRRAGGLTQDYISKLESGVITMPQRGTMDALAGALRVPVAELYRAAGILDGVDEGAVVTADPPSPSPLPPSDDGPFDPAAIVAYVKSRPGRRFQEQVAEEERRLPPDEFTAWCLDVFQAWASNSNLALRSLRRGERARDRGQDERT